MRVGNIDSLNINNLYEIVYDSGELAGAVTSLNITGLNGDVDQEYFMIGRIIWGGDSGGSLLLRFNNDSNANYGHQQGYCYDTTIAAYNSITDSNWYPLSANNKDDVGLFVQNIYVKSGNVRTGIGKEVRGIVGTSIYSDTLRDSVWNNTADNITQINLIANVTDGIGIGSRIILLRKITNTLFRTGQLSLQGKAKNTWQKVYETTLLSAATSITISGLKGNTDILYRLRIAFEDGSVTGNQVNMTFNTDTAGNYGLQRFYAQDTTVAAVRVAQSNMVVSYGTGSGYSSFSESLFYVKAGFPRAGFVNLIYSISGTSILQLAFDGRDWNNSSDELTQIVLTAEESDGMGVGTHIILEKLVLA